MRTLPAVMIALAWAAPADAVPPSKVRDNVAQLKAKARRFSPLVQAAVDRTLALGDFSLTQPNLIAESGAAHRKDAAGADGVEHGGYISAQGYRPGHGFNYVVSAQRSYTAPGLRREASRYVGLLGGAEPRFANVVVSTERVEDGEIVTREINHSERLLPLGLRYRTERRSVVRTGGHDGVSEEVATTRYLGLGRLELRLGRASTSER